MSDDYPKGRNCISKTIVSLLSHALHNPQSAIHCRGDRILRHKKWRMRRGAECATSRRRTYDSLQQVSLVAGSFRWIRAFVQSLQNVFHIPQFAIENRQCSIGVIGFSATRNGGCATSWRRTYDFLQQVSLVAGSFRRIRAFAQSLQNVFHIPQLTIRNRHFIVGVIGFEPTTSCSQSKRSSQAELHPVRFQPIFTTLPYQLSIKSTPLVSS